MLARGERVVSVVSRISTEMSPKRTIALLLPFAVGLVVASSGSARGAEVDLEILEQKTCTACHSTDGTRHVGPTFLGYYGSEITVLRSGRRHVLRVDDDHIRRSIRSPNAEVRVGYPKNTMPTLALTDSELEAVVASLRELGEPGIVAERRRDEGSIHALLATLLLFVLGHLLLSSAPVRPRLIARLGRNGFLGVYSLIAAGAFGGMIWAFIAAPYIPIWTPRLWMRWVPLVAMPVIFVFMVAGFLGKNPAAYGGESALSRDDPTYGMLRVTRHPVLWSYVLWGLCHLPPNGDVATSLLFVGMASLSFLGMLHIDARRQRDLGERWKPFAVRTSLVPFVAILQGRNRLVMRELWLPLILGIAAYVLVLFTHIYVIGVSALPQ